jgi:large subunit ribosomal protein L24
MKRRAKPAGPPVKLTFKKGDTVYVRSGVDRGKHGKVLQVLPASGRVLVEGIRLVKKHMRKTQDNPQGGIVSKEATLPASVLVPYHAGAKHGGKQGV